MEAQSVNRTVALCNKQGTELDLFLFLACHLKTNGRNPPLSCATPNPFIGRHSWWIVPSLWHL